MKKDLLKILTSQGLGSKRECRKMIMSGKVSINSEVIKDFRSEWECTGFEFEISGEKLTYQENIYLLMNKPKGYECSHIPTVHEPVYALLPPHFLGRNVECAGRLDVDTSGALLFSDDGKFLHHVTSPKRKLDKEYLVHCKHEINEEMLAQLREGVLLHHDNELSECIDLKQVDSHKLLMVINEGKYHQVKRMIAAAGNRVVELHRTRLGELVLADLKEGDWSYLSAAELDVLGYQKV